MRSGSLALLVVAVGAGAIGFVGGWSLPPRALAAPAAASPAKTLRSKSEPADEVPVERPATRNAPREPEGEEPASGTSVDARTPEAVGLFSPALLEHFDRDFRRGWASVRSQPPMDADVALALGRFREYVEELPFGLGQRNGTTANERDEVRTALDTGDGVALLHLLEEGDVELSPSDFDAALFDRVFARGVTSEVVDGARLAAGDWLADGTELTFGPGFHVLDEGLVRGEDGQTFPEELTISGAGMNRTLVELTTDFSPRSAVRKLLIRDLTLDCGNNYALDLRRGGAEIDLQRVRIVRFDMGAGGSVVFGTKRGVLVRAHDSEILGGYGRSPGSGNLFQDRTVIASFVGCRFEQLDPNLDGPFLGKVEFRGCSFDHMPADPLESRHASFPGSSTETVLSYEEYYLEERERSLDELFPGWSNWSGR